METDGTTPRARKRTWSRPALATIDRNLADWLPPLSDSHTAAGTLRPELAARYGFPAEVVVSAGGGDNMMGAIGTGNVSPGVISASFGTSGTIYAAANQPVVDPQGEIAAFCSSAGGRYAMFTMIANRSAAASDKGNVPCPSSMGFIVAATMNGTGSLRVAPSTET